MGFGVSREWAAKAASALVFSFAAVLGFASAAHSQNIELISSTPQGDSANGESGEADVSADGRWVVFVSSADDLVPEEDDWNHGGFGQGHFQFWPWNFGHWWHPQDHKKNVFLRDRASGMTLWISAGRNGDEPNGESRAPRISAGGRYVVFESDASNLIWGDDNWRTDIFLYDVVQDQIERISENIDSSSLNAKSTQADVSADGRYVVFVTRSDELLAGDTNHRNDVYLKDRSTGETLLVSASYEGIGGDGTSQAPAISDDGRYVAFESTSRNLINSESVDGWNIFVKDMATQEVRLVSKNVPLTATKLVNRRPEISGDGQVVAFESRASEMFHPLGGEADWQIVVSELLTQESSVISRSPSGALGNLDSWGPHLSGDGRFVVFNSYASNLVNTSSHPVAGAYIFERLKNNLSRALTLSGSVPAWFYRHDDDQQVRPLTRISSDGRSIVIESTANLVADDHNYLPDVYLLFNDEAAGAIGAISAELGGTVTVEDSSSPIFGASITVPPSALAQDVTIRLSEPPELVQAADSVAAGPTVEIAPSGTVFNQPATVVVPYYPGVPDPWKLALLVQESLDDPGVYVPAVFIDVENNLLFAEVSHLSYFTVACPSQELVCTPRRALADVSRGAVSAPQDDLGNGPSDTGSLDGSGRYVAFESTASNLVAGDTNRVSDIFVRDRDCDAPDCQLSDRVFDAAGAARTVRISVSTEANEEADGASEHPSISADGRFVAFQSLATNLADGFGLKLIFYNGNFYWVRIWNIYVHDRDADGNGIFDETFPGATRTYPVSKTNQGVAGNSHSIDPVISANGQFIAFSSTATNFATGDTATSDIFVHDRELGTTNLVSATSGDVRGNFGSEKPTISATGRYIAFQSLATNLAGPVGNPYIWDVFVKDMATGAVEDMSQAPNGDAGNGNSQEPSISDDGAYVAFQSWATNLVPNDPFVNWDIFVRKRGGGVPTLVSQSSAGVKGNGSSLNPEVSADGRFVVFESDASNLVSPFAAEQRDSNLRRDVFVHLLQERVTERVSNSSVIGIQANGTSRNASFSADGKSVIFQSLATNLVESDTNRTYDVFSTTNPFYKPRLVLISAPQPTVKAGDFWQPFVLEVRDAFGNVLPDIRGCVELVVTGGSEDFATGQVECAENGTVIFDAVSYLRAEPIIFNVQSLFLLPLEDDLVVTVEANTATSLSLFPPPGSLLLAAGAFALTGPSTEVAGKVWSPLDVYVKDAYGNLVSSDSNSQARIANFTGTSGFTGGSLVTYTADQGVITFDQLTYEVAEEVAFDLEDPSGVLENTEARDNQVLIVPGDPARLFVQMAPVEAVAGEPWPVPVTVDVQDTYGNRVVSDNSSIVDVIHLGGPELTGQSIVSVTTQNGRANFDQLLAELAGTVLLDFVSEPGALTSGMGVSVEIVPSAPRRLEFLSLPPSVVLAHQPWAPFAIQVQDRFGNLAVQESAATIEALVLSGPAGFSSASATLAPVDGGIGIFGNLAYELPGVVLIGFVDSSYTLDSPDLLARAVYVDAPDVAQITLATAPQISVQAGERWPAIVAELRDQMGFLVPTAAGELAITLNNASGTLIGETLIAASSGVGRFSGLSYSVSGTSLPEQITAEISFVEHPDVPPATVAIQVAPGLPDHLVLTGLPVSPVSPDTPWPSFSVRIEDRSGNLASSAANLVDLKLLSFPAGGPAALQGTASQYAVGGVATFDGISYPAGGTLQVTATSEGLSSAPAAAVTITGGGGPPPPQSAGGVSFDPPLQLSLGQVPFSSASGFSALPQAVIRVENNNQVPLTVTSKDFLSNLSGSAPALKVRTLAAPSGFGLDGVIEPGEFAALAVEVDSPGIVSGSQTLGLMVNAQDPSGQVHASAYSISADFVDVGSTTAVIYPYAGPVQLGSISFNQIRSQLAQLVNLSPNNLPVEVTGLSAISGDLGSFALNLPPGASTTLPPGGKVDFTVSFVGRMEGAHAASATFSIDDGSGPMPVSQTFEGEMTGSPTVPKISRASFVCGGSGESYLEVSGTGFGHLPIERGLTFLIVDSGTPVVLQDILDAFSDARATESLILVPVSALGDLVPGTEQTLQVQREVDGAGLLSDTHPVAVPVESIFCGAGAAMLSSARFVCDGPQNLRLEVAGANFISGTHALDLSGMVIPIAALESPKASTSLLSLPYTGASGPLDITVTNLLAPGINETSTLHVTAPDASAFCGTAAPTPRITRAYYECQSDIPSLVLEGENFTSGGEGWRQELLESALVIDAGEVPNPFAGSRISVTTPFDAVRVTAGPNATLERPVLFNPFFFGNVSKTKLRFPFSASIPGEGIRIALATPQGISNYIEGLSPDLSGRPCSVLARGNEITGALPGGTNPVPVDGSLQSLVAADMDGDGDKDIVAAGAGMPGSLSLIRNNIATLGSLDVETLAFQVGAIPDRNVASGLPQNPLLALADFDGAFGTDIAVVGEGSPGLVSVLFNTGAGTFGSVQTYSLTGDHPVGIAAARLRDAGPLDLVVASEVGIEIFLGDGLGGFASTPVVEPLSGGAYALAAGDFDLADPAEEIVVAHGSDASPLFSVLQTDGFTGLIESRVEMDLADVIAEPFLLAASFATLVQGRPRSIEAVDVDGDGDLDLSLPGLLLVNFSQNRFLADGTMPFEGPRDLRQAFFFTQTSAPVDVVRTGDFDGDGLSDILGLARGMPATLPVALGCPRESEYFLIPPLASCLRLSGDAGLGPDGAFNFFGQISNLPFVPSTLAVADLNGDGRDDVVTGNTDGTLAYIPARDPQPVATSAFGQPFVPQDPAGLVFSTPPRAHELAGSTWKPFSVSLIDEFGVLAQASGVPVTVSAVSGPGVISGTLTKQTTNGVALFDDLSYDTAGAVTLSVTTPGLSGTLTSETLVEDEAPAFRLVFEPSALDFGTVAAGDTRVLTAIARNFGPTTSLADVSVSNLAGTPFALLGATQEVTDSSLSTGEDITLYFRFTPLDTQPVSEEFSAHLNSDPGNVFTLTLTGNQVATSQPPLVSVVPDLFAGEDSLFTYSLGSHASDPDNDPLYFGIENLPVWAIFNSLTGELSGLPLNEDVGEYPGVVLKVTDLHTAEVLSNPFTITVENVNDAPSLLLTESAFAAFQDEPFVLEIEAEDVDLALGLDSLIFSVNGQDATGMDSPLAGLPWASLVQVSPSKAVLYGTPANADVTNLIQLEVSVRDALGESGSQVLALTVHDKNDAPVFGAIPSLILVDEDAPDWQFELQWSDPDRLHDPDHQVTFSDNGTLPVWAAIEPFSGVLLGAPGNEDVGLYGGIVVTARDEFGASASTPAFSIEVRNINDAPVISGVPPPGIVAIPWLFTPSWDDPDIPNGDHVSFSLSSAPPWMAIDADTGTVSGTAPLSDANTEVELVLTITDSYPASSSLGPVGISILPNHSPSVSGSPALIARDGEPYSFMVTYGDPDPGDVLEISLSGASWLQVQQSSQSSAVFAGIPDETDIGSTLPVEVTVTDLAGNTAVLSFSLSVAAAVPEFDGMDVYSPPQGTSSIASPPLNPPPPNIFDFPEVAQNAHRDGR